MPNYLVQWRIDAEEETPQAAAREAWAAMRAPGSIANVFEVIDKETGEVVDVDLWKLAGAGDPCLCGGDPVECAFNGCVCQPARPKHTPGPWYVKGHTIMVNRPERAHLGEGAPETVCEMNSSLSPEATAANARLMAHSPDLLTALEEFVEDVRVAYLGKQPDSELEHSALMKEWPDLIDTFRHARAAIARAKAGR